MARVDVAIAGIGWVLPTGAGAGADILDRAEWCDLAPGETGALDDFDVKPYLSSVKGYLDPASAYALAAGSLATGRNQDSAEAQIKDDAGICTVTRYGAPASGYRFYEQFLRKGARFASPLVFPHSYSNTAGNLMAIEFGYGGPHMVYYGCEDCAEALLFACRRLEDGSAANMLVGAYEAAPPETLPDNTPLVTGAIVLWLTSDPDRKRLLTIAREDVSTAEQRNTGKGSVDNMLGLLQTFVQGAAT